MMRRVSRVGPPSVRSIAMWSRATLSRHAPAQAEPARHATLVGPAAPVSPADDQERRVAAVGPRSGDAARHEPVAAFSSGVPKTLQMPRAPSRCWSASGAIS